MGNWSIYRDRASIEIYSGLLLRYSYDDWLGNFPPLIAAYEAVVEYYAVRHWPVDANRGDKAMAMKSAINKLVTELIISVTQEVIAIISKEAGCEIQIDRAKYHEKLASMGLGTIYDTLLEMSADNPNQSPEIFKDHINTLNQLCADVRQCFGWEDGLKDLAIANGSLQNALDEVLIGDKAKFKTSVKLLLPVPVIDDLSIVLNDQWKHFTQQMHQSPMERRG